MNAPHEPARRLTIDVFSDVVCPWCFIGKRRLEKALAQVPEFDIELTWRPFFLNPWVPAEGMPRKAYLEAKFGSVERYQQNMPRMIAAGAQEGIAFAFDRMQWQPNTMDCHRLLRWANQNGKADALKERLMALYFLEGANLSDAAVLVQAAADSGMDASDIRERLASDIDRAEVAAEATAASESGISGVPCFIFAGALAVSGAQEPSVLADAMRRAAAMSSGQAAAE
jgi:predicted DsbA family dithiol-disulfide isomerase